jgi:hypothetical protein
MKLFKSYRINEKVGAFTLLIDLKKRRRKIVFSCFALWSFSKS